MSRSPKPKLGTTVFLYIFGVAFVVAAIIILLKGLGIIPSIPEYVIWALALFVLGIGIIGGIKNFRG